MDDTDYIPAHYVLTETRVLNLGGRGAMPRLCAAPDCDVVLSRYNRRDYCGLHQGDPLGGTFEEALAEVVATYGVSEAEILAPPPGKRVVRARYHLIRRLSDMGMSTRAIGRYIGRDHSTVTHFLHREEP